MIIIGVDCATQKKNTGLSFAVYKEGRCYLQKSQTAIGERSVAETIASWLAGYESFLLAMDAPLGWPARLGEKLHVHTAGETLDGEANSLFRRMTDKYVKEKIGKTPLDVGADRIARTAHTALSTIGELRKLTGLELDMAWDPTKTIRSSVIEVYPAATLKTYGMIYSGYKDTDKSAIRREMVSQLKQFMEIDESLEEAMVADADILDSALCVLAGVDFLEGRVHVPANLELVRKEGWIWFRKD
jgi:predicted RNase H-like nuclease